MSLQVAGRSSHATAPMRNLFRATRHLRCHPEIANPVRSNLEPSIDRHGTIRDDGHRRKLFLPPEPAPPPFAAIKRVLGGLFRFESNSRDLIDLVEAAYGGLPSRTLPGVAAEFRVEMHLFPQRTSPWATEPPAPRIHQEGRLFRGGVDAPN